MLPHGLSWVDLGTTFSFLGVILRLPDLQFLMQRLVLVAFSVTSNPPDAFQDRFFSKFDPNASKFQENISKFWIALLQCLLEICCVLPRPASPIPVPLKAFQSPIPPKSPSHQYWDGGMRGAFEFFALFSPKN